MGRLHISPWNIRSKFLRWILRISTHDKPQHNQALVHPESSCKTESRPRTATLLHSSHFIIGERYICHCERELCRTRVARNAGRGMWMQVTFFYVTLSLFGNVTFIYNIEIECFSFTITFSILSYIKMLLFCLAISVNQSYYYYMAILLINYYHDSIYMVLSVLTRFLKEVLYTWLTQQAHCKTSTYQLQIIAQWGPTIQEIDFCGRAIYSKVCSYITWRVPSGAMEYYKLTTVLVNLNRRYATR